MTGSSISNIIKVGFELQISSRRWRSEGNPKPARERDNQNRGVPGSRAQNIYSPSLGGTQEGAGSCWVPYRRFLAVPRAAIGSAHAVGIILSYLIKQSLFSHFLARQLLAQ